MIFSQILGITKGENRGPIGILGLVFCFVLEFVFD